MTDRATDVLVVGASVAGLMAALALDRRGVDVTLVDADPATATSGVGDDPPRRATPQAGHSHTFLARCRLLLLAEAPDALDALLAAGGHEIVLAEQRAATVPAHAAHPDTAQLVALAARRSTFEAALREVAHRRPGIRRLSPRRAVALVVSDRQVRAVVFDDGSSVTARLVIDATGRRTPMPGWLAADHDIAVDEQSEECGIAYLTRFYRRPPGAPDLLLDRGFAAGGSFDRYSCLVFPGDGATFSVTFGVLPEDRTLRGLLREPDAFDAAVRSIPSLAPWLDAEPISEVRVMAGLVNRLRNPIVPGWTAVGDAAATTNPAHSRGCTLAAVHAVAVADAVSAHDDPAALARACAAVVDVEQAPWVADSIDQDRERLARWRSSGRPPRMERHRLTNGEAFAAARHDAYVWRRFNRLQQLLDKPDEVLADPRVVARVRAVQASGARSPGLDGPTHAELVELLSGERVA